jgi:hypothetical protein
MDTAQLAVCWLQFFGEQGAKCNLEEMKVKEQHNIGIIAGRVARA